MKPYTIQQNRRACKKALELYLQGDLDAARNAAKRVSWAFLYCWLESNYAQTGSKDEKQVTDAIKGRIVTDAIPV